MIRFDRFTTSAQEAAQQAAEIMQRYSHHQIDTEHVLLALIAQPQGVVSQLLELLRVDKNALSERLDTTLHTGPGEDIVDAGPGQVSITPRVARMVDLAIDEATRLHDELISDEHLFPAILSKPDTPAARLLEGVGLTRNRVYEAIQKMRG